MTFNVIKHVTDLGACVLGNTCIRRRILACFAAQIRRQLNYIIYYIYGRSTIIESSASSSMAVMTTRTQGHKPQTALKTSTQLLRTITHTATATLPQCVQEKNEFHTPCLILRISLCNVGNKFTSAVPIFSKMIAYCALKLVKKIKVEKK